MRRKFLKPITIVALSVLTGLSAHAATQQADNKTSSSIQAELQRIKNFRTGISKEDFLKPVDRVLLAEVSQSLEGMTFRHRSHYSHRSHSSHRSHYSSSY